MTVNQFLRDRTIGNSFAVKQKTWRELASLRWVLRLMLTTYGFVSRWLMAWTANSSDTVVTREHETNSTARRRRVLTSQLSAAAAARRSIHPSPISSHTAIAVARLRSQCRIQLRPEVAPGVLHAPILTTYVRLIETPSDTLPIIRQFRYTNDSFSWIRQTLHACDAAWESAVDIIDFCCREKTSSSLKSPHSQVEL